MLFKKKSIPDATALRMVAKLLKRQPATKGFNLKTNSGYKTVSYDELIKFVEALADRLDDGRYGEIRRCDTCGNFSRSGGRKSMGACFPKNYSSGKKTTDYCSGWIPMNEEQKHIKKRMDEHFAVQTK